MANVYSKVNGVTVPIAVNKCVLINESQNVVFPNGDQTRYPSVTDVHSSTEDILDTDVDRRVVNKRPKSIVSLGDTNLKPSKFIFIIGLCCIIGLSLPSIILYFVQVDTTLHDDMYTPPNLSMVCLTFLCVLVDS